MYDVKKEKKCGVVFLKIFKTEKKKSVKLNFFQRPTVILKTITCFQNLK